MKQTLNSKMSLLLSESGISIPLAERQAAAPLAIPVFKTVDGSVLLKKEFERSQHVKIADTGYECFINHVHLPFGQTREALVSCLRYAIALQRGLVQVHPRRKFRVIVSVGDGDCTVRFHEERTGESWIADNLEGYTEAVLVLDGG